MIELTYAPLALYWLCFGRIHRWYRIRQIDKLLAALHENTALLQAMLDESDEAAA